MATSVKNYQTSAAIVKMTILGLGLILLWGELEQVEAGCSRFGHSCFGAHGKRSDGSPTAALNDILIPSGEMPVFAGGYAAQPVRSEYYPNYVPVASNRISPYLIDLLMSAHRNELRQPSSISKEELALAERRK